MCTSMINSLFFSTAKFKRFLFIFLATVSLTLFSANIAKQHDVYIGVLAVRGIEKCVKQWTPTADYLTKNIPGYTFHIVPLAFNEVMPQLKKQKFDFVLVNSGIYIKLEEKFGAARIATLLKRYKDKGYSRYGGVVFTRSDRADIKKASDLKGKTFGTPALNAFISWNSVCYELHTHGIYPEKDFGKVEYLGSHDSVVEAVRNGNVDVGSIRTDVLERLADKGKIKLEDFRIICPKKITAEFPFVHSTKLYPEWPFAVFPGVPRSLVKKVAEVLLNIPPDSPAARAANSTGWTIPENYESVKECLKAVKAPPYEHYGEVTFAQALHQYWIDFLIIFSLLIFIVVLALYVIKRNRQILASTEIIRDKEEKLRNIFENSSNVFYSHTPEGAVTYISPQIQELIGYTQEEACGKWADFLSDNPINKTASERTKAAVDTGKTQPPYELEMRHKDGHNIFVEVREEPLVIDGKTVAITGALIDITERKKAETELRLERDRIKGILAIMPDGVSVIGQNFDMEYLNPVILDSFGEVKGRKCYEYLHGLSAPCSNCTLDKVMKGEPVHWEWPESANNRIFDVFNALYKNSDGSDSIFAVLRDITDMKHAQEILSATLDSIGDAVISTDRDGMILSMNPVAEKLTGLKTYEAKGDHYNTIFSALNTESGVSAAELIKDNLLSNDIAGFDDPITLQSKTGEESKIAISSTPMKDDSGNTMGVIFVLRDITQELRAIDALNNAEKLNSIGTLAGGIAHDFNNILTAILGNISIAKMKLPEDHPAYKFINDTESSISRATNLAYQLLTFAKGGKPVREDVDLVEIVKNVVHFDLTGSNVKPVIKVADDLWEAKADKGQLQQVLSNLTVNANQAMPDGGHLYIILENSVVENGTVENLEAGKYIKVTVRDEGVGIAEKHIKSIFDPYFTTKQTGNGLGLATIYSIIAKHGGVINVESKLGAGATFTLYIPASDKITPTVKKSADKQQKETQNLTNTRILVMDDEEIIRSLIETLLGDAGYSVVTTEDGLEALEQYKQSMAEGNPFDAVIMDLKVPTEWGGKKTVGEILKIDPNAKCIVASGYSEDPVMANYKDYGFVARVSKPFSIKGLVNVVGDVITNDK